MSDQPETTGVPKNTGIRPTAPPPPAPSGPCGSSTSAGHPTPPPPPPPPPPVSVRTVLGSGDGPDVSWVDGHTVPIMDDRPRGVLLPPDKEHGCFPPNPDGLREGSTWDCPECGVVLVLQVYATGDTIWRPITLVWNRASRSTARKHRRRVERGDR